MSEIIQHIVNYSLDELKEIARNLEVISPISGVYMTCMAMLWSGAGITFPQIIRLCLKPTL